MKESMMYIPSNGNAKQRVSQGIFMFVAINGDEAIAEK